MPIIGGLNDGPENSILKAYRLWQPEDSRSDADIVKAFIERKSQGDVRLDEETAIRALNSGSRSRLAEKRSSLDAGPLGNYRLLAPQDTRDDRAVIEDAKRSLGLHENVTDAEVVTHIDTMARKKLSSVLDSPDDNIQQSAETIRNYNPLPAIEEAESALPPAEFREFRVAARSAQSQVRGVLDNAFDLAVARTAGEEAPLEDDEDGIFVAGMKGVNYGLVDTFAAGSVDFLDLLWATTKEVVAGDGPGEVDPLTGEVIGLGQRIIERHLTNSSVLDSLSRGVRYLAPEQQNGLAFQIGAGIGTSLGFVGTSLIGAGAGAAKAGAKSIAKRATSSLSDDLAKVGVSTGDDAVGGLAKRFVDADRAATQRAIGVADDATEAVAEKAARKASKFGVTGRAADTLIRQGKPVGRGVGFAAGVGMGAIGGLNEAVMDRGTGENNLGALTLGGLSGIVEYLPTGSLGVPVGMPTMLQRHPPEQPDQV